MQVYREDIVSQRWRDAVIKAFHKKEDQRYLTRSARG